MQVSEQTNGKNENDKVKLNESTENTTTSDGIEARTSPQSKSASPPSNITSNTRHYCNNQATELEKIPLFAKLQKKGITGASGNHYSHLSQSEPDNYPEHNQALHNIDTVPHSAETSQLNHPSPHSGAKSRGELSTPGGTLLSSSEVFTYYNPVVTNTLGNNTTSPSTSDNDLQRTSVFISRNQTTSPNRRGRQGTCRKYPVYLAFAIFRYNGVSSI